MTEVDATRLTTGDLLDKQADRLGDHDALVHVEHGVRYSYESLREECDRFARLHGDRSLDKTLIDGRRINIGSTGT